MKKFLLSAAALLLISAGNCAAQSQSFFVVNSETVFKSIDAYNTAVKEIENASTSYQKEIDNAFDQLESDYKAYQSNKAAYSAAERQSTEQKIINRENEITKYQESIFGDKGKIATMREEKLKPIQDKVFKIIDSYAAEMGYGLAIDIAQNPTVLYYAPTADKTESIINLVKKSSLSTSIAQ